MIASLPLACVPAADLLGAQRMGVGLLGNFLAQAAQPPLGSLLVPMVAIGFLYYMMLIKPEQKKRQEHLKLMSELKKRDRVVTAGGLYGTVANVKKDSAEVTLLIDENNNTKIKVQRSSITRVITDEKKENDKDKDKS